MTLITNKTPFPGLLLVGGSGRKVGKSTFMELLIQKFGKEYPLIAIKVSNIMLGDEDMHGQHDDLLSRSFVIIEETEPAAKKDSKRFLAAGATRSFFIRTFDEHLTASVEALRRKIGTTTLFVAESNSLGRYFEPDLRFIITKPTDAHSKPGLNQMILDADFVMDHFDKEYFTTVINRISTEQSRWYFNSNE